MAAYTTIDDPSAYFKVQLYTGNGSANHAITFDDTDTDMQPDLVWIKCRDDNIAHCWFDAVRGATKVLHCHNSDAETTDADTLDSFTSDGFQVDADTKVNTNTDKYVAFCWKAGTTSGITTNAATDITPSAYSFNQTSGFSILAYTGNGTSGSQLAHGLGATPDMFISKERGGSSQWSVFHQSIGNTGAIVLNTAAATETDAGTGSWNYWHRTDPDSVNVTLGSTHYVNNTSDTYIGYCFKSIQGFSKFGKYTGNGNVDGPFLWCGFRPAFFFMKRTDTGSNWTMFHNRTTPGNEIYVSQDINVLNDEDADTGYNDVDFCANGVKIREDNNDLNQSGSPFVYAAFAEAPFVTGSGGVPCNAR